jgi:hypothetical protein
MVAKRNWFVCRVLLRQTVIWEEGVVIAELRNNKVIGSSRTGN